MALVVTLTMLDEETEVQRIQYQMYYPASNKRKD
jgi:hypothetical protein